MMRKKIAALLSIAVLLLSFSVADAQTVKLKIIKKPHPKGARKCSPSAGTALVRVTFHSSGTVSDVELRQSSGCYAFDQSALEVARRIEFEPEMKDGEAVTVVKMVEYSYRIY